MSRQINTLQLRSHFRQIDNEHRQAISKYNQEVRRHNQNVRSAVSQYNSAVRQYNARFRRANRQQVIYELNRLQSRMTRCQALHESTFSLNRSYQSLESYESEFENILCGNQFLNTSEKDNVNSRVASLNALETNEPETRLANDEDLLSTTISSELCSISADLDSMWKGALFSLSPKNPDASRHFCTSAREIFIQIINHLAPDYRVISRFPGCEKTDKGHPTRRWKISYILLSSGISSDGAVDFADEDITNVLQLFPVFNDGTHGSAGKFEFTQLRTIKERIESGIIYLTTICRIA